MTTTEIEETGTAPPFEIITQAEADAMTRAQLLERLVAAGVPATAWNRARMAAVLTGAEPAPLKKDKAKAGSRSVVAAPRRDEEEPEKDDLSSLSLAAKIALHVGPCIAPNCKCERFEFGRKDAFGWRLCECQHTDQGHSIPPELRAGVEAEFKAKRGRTS